MYGLEQQVLRTDIAGMPLEWINFEDAVRLYHAGNVAYVLGEELYTIHGGICALTGLQSQVAVNSIIATEGGVYAWLKNHSGYTPPLSNQALFRRDFNLCLYCGNQFSSADLSRDHIKPLVQGGVDNWNNVVASCKRCNHHKGGRTPEQAGMELMAIPFVPNYAEYVFLQGRKILADQMDFLRAHWPRTSPLHQRFEAHAERIAQI